MELELGREDHVVGKVPDTIPTCFPDTNTTVPSPYNKYAQCASV
jgi:hypothetical protein